MMRTLGVMKGSRWHYIKNNQPKTNAERERERRGAGKLL